MNEDKDIVRHKITTIEQIFQEIVGRNMTAKERQILLRKPKKRKKTRKTT
jgi:hypothetical protein